MSVVAIARSYCSVRFLILVAAVFFFGLLAPRLYHHRLSDPVDDSSAALASQEALVESEFQPTPDELACLRGDLAYDDEDGLAGGGGGTSGSAAKDPHALSVPNIVHFLFLFRAGNENEDPDTTAFDFIAYLAVRSAALSLRPDHIFLHYTYVPRDIWGPGPHGGPNPADLNDWVRRLADSPDVPLTTVYHRPPLGPPRGLHPWLIDDPAANAHESARLRLRILLREGGVYMDRDTLALRPALGGAMRPPPGRDLVLGAAGGNRARLHNALMVARPGSAFVRRWLGAFADDTDPPPADAEADDRVDHAWTDETRAKAWDEAEAAAAVARKKLWDHETVVVPVELAQGRGGGGGVAMRDKVCTLAPSAFFWPTWTRRHVEWMHTPLASADAEHWKQEIEHHGGSLFDGQVAYSAWGEASREGYLSKLTPEDVRKVDTPFNLLVRRFLEPDLGL